jgi:hypothetical protein
LVRAIYYEDARYEPVDPILLSPIDDLELSEQSNSILKAESIRRFNSEVQS